MLNSFKIWKNIKFSRILSAKISALAIILLVFSSSCMAPRPSRVRSRKSEIVKNSPEIREVERKKEEVGSSGKLDPHEYIKLLDEAQAQSGEKRNTTLEIPILKPLDEQISLLENRQSKTENDVNAINKKIANLESSIARLNTVIDNLSSHLKPNAGPENNEIAENNQVELEKESEAKFIIKSDEEVAAENSDRKNSKDKKEKEQEKSEDINDPLIPEGTPKSEIEKLNELSFSLAEAYLEKDDFSKAIKKLQEIENRITEVTEKSKVSMLLGESHFGLNQYAKAINYFIKVLQMPEFGQHDKARMMIAESHVAQGETKKAKNYYKDLVDQNPKSTYIPKAKMMLQRL